MIVVALLVACSSTDTATEDAIAGQSQTEPSGSTSAPESPPPAATTPATSSPPAAPATSPSDATPAVIPLVAPDGPALLDQAFAELAAGYHFITVATVQGALALSAEGDHVGDATQLSVTSNGATLGYIVTPEGSWVSNDSVWQELDELAPITDPISTLTDPIDVTVSTYGEGSATLAATYPGTALALPDEATVTVLFETVGTSIVSMTYTPTADTQTFVRADISALAAQTSITVPALDG